jgi:hypothetical protein
LSLFGKLNAFFDDSFHIGPFGANDPSGHLEISFILNLNIVSTGELILFLTILVIVLLIIHLILLSRTILVHKLPVDRIKVKRQVGH